MSTLDLAWDRLMSKYAAPEFTVEEVNKAGKTLLAFQQDPFISLDGSLDVIENWRAAHAYPAQNVYMTVKRHAKKLGRDDGVAQRIKRMPSIVDKLMREDDMKLSQMQDIAGVRAVVKDVAEVVKLQESLTKANWTHEALKPKDYIAEPKASGYRGVHLKYRYMGTGNKVVYSKLKVEIQLRSQLQHQWATAVEAADAFTRQSLKQSKGDPAWKRFFALMSSVFAITEGLPLVPGTPDSYWRLCEEIWTLNSQHHIANVFSGFATLIPRIEGDKNNSRYFLLTLDPVARRARIQAFKKEETGAAQAAYRVAEQTLPKDSLTQIVLVSTSSIRALKRVYPNYFLDTVEFNKVVAKVLEDATVSFFEQSFLE